MKKWIPLFLIVFLAGCAGSSGYKPAEKYLERQEYTKALRAYLKVLDPHVRDGRRYINYEKEAVTGMGIVYWRMQRFETAEKIFTTVLKKDPFFGQAIYYLGMTYEGMADEARAIHAYSAYMELPQNDPYKHVIVGRLDWLKRTTYYRELQKALQNESQLGVDQLNKKSVAVMYFMDMGKNPSWTPLQKGLADLIIRDLKTVESIEVVDRYKINALMQERNLTVADLSNENMIPQYGRLLNAYHIVTGSFNVTPDMRMTVDATVLSADAALFPDRMNFEGSLPRLFKIEKELVLRIIDDLGVSLDLMQRQRLLELPTENMEAFLSYSQGLDALDRDDLETAQNYFRTALEQDPSFTWADNWLMLPEVWIATQNRNLVRVDHEVTRLVRTTSKGRIRMVYKPAPELLSTWNRLQWMSLGQNAGYIPGNDTREAFQESVELGAGIFPEMLAEPPAPVPSEQDSSS
jgi:tetratricopeptide (TPR) repeat protein